MRYLIFCDFFLSYLHVVYIGPVVAECYQTAGNLRNKLSLIHLSLDTCELFRLGRLQRVLLSFPSCNY